MGLKTVQKTVIRLFDRFPIISWEIKTPEPEHHEVTNQDDVIMEGLMKYMYPELYSEITKMKTMQEMDDGTIKEVR